MISQQYSAIFCNTTFLFLQISSPSYRTFRIYCPIGWFILSNISVLFSLFVTNLSRFWILRIHFGRNHSLSQYVFSFQIHTFCLLIIRFPDIQIFVFVSFCYLQFVLCMLGCIILKTTILSSCNWYLILSPRFALLSSADFSLVFFFRSLFAINTV